jgi:hypothetical protein
LTDINHVYKINLQSQKIRYILEDVGLHATIILKLLSKKWEGLHWAYDSDQWLAVAGEVMKLRNSITGGEFLE